jgi:hypothetical protein
MFSVIAARITIDRRLLRYNRERYLKTLTPTLNSYTCHCLLFLSLSTVREVYHCPSQLCGIRVEQCMWDPWFHQRHEWQTVASGAVLVISATSGRLLHLVPPTHGAPHSYYILLSSMPTTSAAGHSDRISPFGTR